MVDLRYRTLLASLTYLNSPSPWSPVLLSLDFAPLCLISLSRSHIFLLGFPGCWLFLISFSSCYAFYESYFIYTFKFGYCVKPNDASPDICSNLDLSLQPSPYTFSQQFKLNVAKPGLLILTPKDLSLTSFWNTEENISIIHYSAL